MSLLTVSHWQNTFRARRRIPAEQLQSWQQGLEQLELDAELESMVGSEEWVLIRRLRLKTRIAENQGEQDAKESWRAALSQELRELIENEHSDIVVRYRNRRDAVGDMLYRAACGDLSRVWAWEQMKLLPHSNAHSISASTILRHATQHLLSEPTAIWPLLTRLIAAEAKTGALTVLLQKLPKPDLNALLATCPQTSPYQRMDREPVYSQKQASIRLQSTPLVCLLMSWISDHPWLIQDHLHEIMVLLATASHPADESIQRMDNQLAAQSVLAASRALMDEYFHPTTAIKAAAVRKDSRVSAEPKTQSSRVLMPEKPLTQSPASQTHEAIEPHAHLREHSAELPPPPALPQHEDSAFSEWGGLLFLLHLIPATELLIQLDKLREELKLPPDINRRVLWQIATQHFKIPASDPAVRAFCGGWQPEARQLDEFGYVALPTVLELLVSDAACVLKKLLAEHLANYPELSFDRVCQRYAHIQFEPGWIEVMMPLDQVDARLRRVALDLDPGWLAWLGCVVRFVYE